MTTDLHTDTVFAMPSLGADMTEGRITEWLVAPGDEVERGQIVVVVETEKSDIEVEVFDDAVVIELLVDEGEMVPVGKPIARLGPKGTPVSTEQVESAAEPDATPEAPPPAPGRPSPTAPAGETPPEAS
ncbi:MAG: biotin/lipoyl-containing protein, partial [Ilumatobacteraceae bacterium]